jgi:hypothetical protein
VNGGADTRSKSVGDGVCVGGKLRDELEQEDALLDERLDAVSRAGSVCDRASVHLKVCERKW